MATFGTFVNGVPLKASELNDFFKVTTSLPTIRQSNTVTLNANAQGRYFQVNKTVLYGFYGQCESAGTVGNRIEVDLPVTAATNSVRVIGTGFFKDSSAVDCLLVRVVQVSTTRAAFLTEQTNSLTAFLGQTNGPAITLASGDILSCTFQYEAA